jgi:hypothetical protein
MLLEGFGVLGRGTVALVGDGVFWANPCSGRRKEAIYRK